MWWSMEGFSECAQDRMKLLVNIYYWHASGSRNWERVPQGSMHRCQKYVQSTESDSSSYQMTTPWDNSSTPSPSCQISLACISLLKKISNPHNSIVESYILKRKQCSILERTSNWEAIKCILNTAFAILKLHRLGN